MTPPEYRKLFWRLLRLVESPEANASTELKLVRMKSSWAARMAKCRLSPISTPPPKAMAKALALVMGAEIPPRIGTVTPADKLEWASPNRAWPKTELLPKYAVAVGPNRKLYMCCWVPAEKPKKEIPASCLELPLKSAVTPKWRVKLNVPWPSHPLRLPPRLKLLLPRLLPRSLLA